MYPCIYPCLICTDDVEEIFKKAEAVKNRDERNKIVVKNVPPTTPGI
jgi:DNA-directed RNA polymerase subunit RPC12/RpoP